MGKRSIGTLKADVDAGEGYVELKPEFREEDALYRADVLQDVIFQLRLEYLTARDDMAREFREARAKKNEGKK
jgi:hypothetical protein